MEYSIIAEELKNIIELIADGYKCEKLEADETLYLRLEKDGDIKEFEFVEC